MSFQVSIIIPVYNAEKFLEKAVNSALQFSCVKEIFLIEDASPDNAMALCKLLEAKHSRIKLFTHPNNENRGAGASRNIGIQNATSSYIAFLDADDWYLPNRFDVEIALFQNKNTIDGVYGATGYYYENEKKVDPTRLTTFKNTIESKDLLFEILSSRGWFHTNSITIKKTLLDKIGYMNTTLRLHQDSELFYRISFHGTIQTGNIKNAIAIRRVHDDNRIAHANWASQKKLDLIVFHYFKDKKVSKKTFKVILEKYFITGGTNASYFNRVYMATKTFIKYPNLILKLLL